jgi:hypothetical protein
MDFEKPDDEIINQYKADKQKFIKTLNLNLERGLKEKKARAEQGKVIDIRPIVAEILKDKDKYAYIYQHKWKIKAETIANAFKLGIPTSNKVKVEVERRLASEYPT